MTKSIAIIGFGEAGSTFADAACWGSSAVAWDVAESPRKAMERAGVIAAANPAEALQGAPLVLSLVTAGQALVAAKHYAPELVPGALWCDMNSVAPDTKREAAVAVEAAGGVYVDVAVLAPVNPARLAVPLLISGAAAAQADVLLRDVGFTNTRVVGETIGDASSIKMIRSIMVKGIEALTAEMMLGAEAAGVTEEVLGSLDASETLLTWRERAAYNVERMTTHGLRRAAEMEESVRTLASLGIEPVMTSGTVRRQREMAGKTINDILQRREP